MPGGTTATLVATAFGVGRLPLAPGTWASLAALALLAPLRFASPAAFAVVLAVLVAAGTWAAGRFARAMGRRDPSCVVIDEVAGMGLVLAALPAASPSSILAAFALFRLFDVVKPPPLRLLERLPGGAGIMADDAGAAAFAAAILLWLRP